MRGRVAVCRIGQLCGDSDNGVWNKSEAWPLMLGAGRAIGGLPRLRDERLGWLAVDEAARAVLDVAGFGANEGETVGPGDRAHIVGIDGRAAAARPNDVDGILAEQDADEGLPIYHILNPDTTRTWADLLSWIRKLHPSLEILTPEGWIARLEDPNGNAVGHPARKLVGLWRGAYVRKDDNDDGDEVGRAADGKEEGKGADSANGDDGVGDKERGKTTEKKGGVVFDTTNAQRVSSTMKAVKPISEEAFGKMWGWIGNNVGIENRQDDEKAKSADGGAM